MSISLGLANVKAVERFNAHLQRRKALTDRMGFTLQIIWRKYLRAIWRMPRRTKPHLNLATQTSGLSYAI